MVMRESTARMRCDCQTNCTPTRMALMSRSRPSGLGLCSRRQRSTTKPEATDSTALSANTQTLPALAISMPAVSGPMMREAFIAMPFRPSAAGSCGRGTSSGTMAENTGQRSARPMPLAKVSASKSGAVIMSSAMAAHSTMAVPASQNCVATSQRRRSRMSASAPLGRPSRNTGKVEADCTSATQIGEVVSEVIIHAAATSLIHMQMLAMSQVLHSMRNTGSLSGSSAANFGGCGRAGGTGVSSGEIGGMSPDCAYPLSLRARRCSSRRSIVVSTSVITQYTTEIARYGSQ
jgi:hypothetical protein